MVTENRRSREIRRDELKAQLIDAMAKLIANRETRMDISVERLAAQAGISRSTFYVYFADKNELLLSWLEDIGATVASQAKPWYMLPALATKSELRNVLGHLLHTMRPYAAVFSVAGLDPELQESLRGLMEKQVSGLARHIRQGQETEGIDPALRVQETAEWLTWMAERGLSQLAVGANQEQFARLVESYIDIVWNTLYRNAPARTR